MVSLKPFPGVQLVGAQQGGGGAYKRAPTCEGSGDICNIVYLRFILNKILFINTCEAEKGRETEKRRANA